jgi:predicted MFS family arabinose efflux permease
MDSDITLDVPITGSEMRVVSVLCLSFFLAVINFAASAPFFPQMADDLGTDVSLLGQVTATMTFLSAMLGLAVGPLADRYGYRRLMIGGVVAVACNLIGTGLAPSYATLLILAILGGLGDAILFGLPLAIAGTSFAGNTRRRAISWISAALPVGVILGVPIVAAVGGVIGWRAMFVSIGLLTLASAWLTASFLPPDVRRGQQRFRLSMLRDAYQPLIHDRSLLILYAVSGLRAMSWIGLATYVGAFLIDELSLGSNSVAVAYMGGGVGVFLGSVLAGSRFVHVPLRPLVAWTTAFQGLLAGATFVLPVNLAPVIVLLAVSGFLGAFSMIGLTTLLATETRAGVGTTMVLNGSIINLGTAAGAAIGGVLLAVGGYHAIGLGLPVFALLAALLMWIDRGSDTMRIR